SSEVDLGPPSPPGSATKRISRNCPGVISLVHKNLLPDPFPLQWIKETGRVDFSSFKGGVARPWTGEWPARVHAAKKRTHVATTQPSLQPSLPNCTLAAHPTSSWTFLHTSLPLALALGQLLDTREAESSRGGSLRTTPQRRARSPRWDCSRPLQGGRPESRSPRGRGSRMLANKNPESPHRLETSSRREDPLSKPSLGSWALEVMPMASPQTLLLWLLVLAVTEGQGRQVAIPGCHLHPFNVTVRSDRQGTCQGSHVAQACVGHCESSAFPSRYSVLVASGYRHNITSVSQCCTISGLSKVKVQLQCGGNRREELEIFTARACQCDMCRLSRY
uniref:Glycoprotein hormone alpha-2 n=1 Tax=Equus asinus asinus TaxID=83772 RepID=A0A8C4MJJ7_EQUAS